MAADISAIAYFLPVAAFLIVFAICYAVLLKLKLLGENKWGLLLISFLIATIFISAGGSIKFIGTLVPAFAILLVSIAFLLILLGLIGKSADFMNKGIGVAIVIIFALIFLFTAFFIYSNLVVGYLPGPLFGYNADPNAIPFFAWLYSPQIAGALLLIITSVIVSWILIKAK